MNTEILWSVDDHVNPITGIAGVTDVVAATYNTIYLLKHAAMLFIVSDNDAAKRALKLFPDSALVGESTEPGLMFFSTNSPVAISKVNWTGKTVIQKTNNGTVAVAETIARGADPVFGFHWANIETVADWLIKRKEQRSKINEVKTRIKDSITLIASGGREQVFSHVQGRLLEDWYCCQALKKLIEGKKVNYKKYFELSRKSIMQQYPHGDPSDETKELVLKANTLPGIIPVFKQAGEGIYKVENAI